MQYYDRIDVSEGIDINKTRQCDIFHYLHFLNKGFKFQLCVHHRCHDLLMISMNLNNIYILNIKNDNYSCIIKEMSKSEAIKLFKTLVSVKKKRNIIKNKHHEQF